MFGIAEACGHLGDLFLDVVEMRKVAELAAIKLLVDQRNLLVSSGIVGVGPESQDN